MALPNFNDNGELPEGVYQATIDTVSLGFAPQC
jgi:hypothetical protein